MKRLVMELDQKQLEERYGAYMQGIMFERVSCLYAEQMHLQQRHPYSQYLYRDHGRTLWCVNVLDDEAEQEILKPLADERFQSCEVQRLSASVRVLHKKMEECSLADLADMYGEPVKERQFRIELLTPAAFKQRGNYIRQLDLRLLYQSLIQKYQSLAQAPCTESGSPVFLGDMEITDGLAEQLAAHSEVTSYSLYSDYFPLGRIKIPAFRGWFTLKVEGAERSACTGRLLTFGTYSGVGIKSSMGMGGMRLQTMGKSGK